MNTFTIPPNASPSPLPNDAFLSAQGRFGRRSYLAWNVVVCCLGILAMFVSILPLSLNPNNNSLEKLPSFSLLILGIIGLLITAVLCYFFFIFTIRRLHDLNHSGWLSMFYLIPILNTVFAFYLLLKAGHQHNNQYGQPRPAKRWESIVCILYVSVLALIILLSIFAILGAASV